MQRAKESVMTRFPWQRTRELQRTSLSQRQLRNRVESESEQQRSKLQWLLPWPRASSNLPSRVVLNLIKLRVIVKSKINDKTLRL